MPIPLPSELRTRVVEAFDTGLMSMTEVAERFCVSVSSVSRWVRLSEIYGESKPKPHSGGPSLKISSHELADLRDLVKEKPDRSLDELTEAWNNKFDRKDCRSSINRALIRAGLSFKKRRFDPPSEIAKM